jgi:YD repeat-containing protein
MKKTSKFIILLLSVFCITGCTVKQNNDIKKLNLRGKVKSVKTTSFEAVEKSGEITKGAELKIYNYNERNETNYQYVLFEQSGRITESLFNTMGARDEAEIRNIIKYNDKGLIIENREYCVYGVSNEHTEVVTTFTYDKNNLLIEVKNGDNNSVCYKYDKNGYKIEEKTIQKTIDENSKQIIDNYEFVMNFKNDESGCKIEEYSTSNKNTFKYNGKKELVEEQQFSILADGSLQLNTICIYKYDKNGNITDKTYKNGKGEISSWKTYKYNENEFVQEIISFDNFRETNNKEFFKYEYDNNKNWIKKIIYFNDKPQFIEEREIIYY